MLLNKNIKPIFYSAISALLSFIIVFNLSFNAFHIHTEEHHDEVVQTCSPDEENDACHRFLVHHEKSHSCDGKHEHFSNKNEDCFACTFYKNNQKFFATEQAFVFISQNINSVYFFTEHKFQSSFFHSIFSRGPPVIG